MAAEKVQVHINCTKCNTEFRLWLPENTIPEDTKEERLYCIRCGAPFALKKTPSGIEATPEEIPEQTETKEEKKTHHREEEPRPRVLFVDDDRLSIAIVEDVLSDLVELTTTRTGKEALERLKKEDYSLIVTDLHLKDPDGPEDQLDGEDFLREAAKLDKKVPVILTTGKDIIDDLILDPKWLNLNVKSFIQKGNPFWADELKTKLKEILEIY